MKFNLPHSYSKCQGVKQVGKRVSFSVKQQGCGLDLFDFVLTSLAFFFFLKKIYVKIVELENCYK